MRCLKCLLLSVLVISGCERDAPPEVQFAQPATESIAKTKSGSSDRVENSPQTQPEFVDTTAPYEGHIAGDETHQAVPRDMETPFHGSEPIPHQQQPRQQRRPRPDRPQPMPQPNLLTAGSLNDYANLNAYREYLATAFQNGAGRLAPEFSLGTTATINVIDLQGHGLPNAAVTVRHPATDEVLMTSRTRSDGKLLFASRHHQLPKDGLVRLEVSSNSGFTKQDVSVNNPVWQIQVPTKPARLPHRLDVAFVIDTTGTMVDELEYLKAEIDHVSSTLRTQFPEVEQRYALVCYRDHYDEYLTRTFDFTDSVSGFRGHLSTQRARGGGDYPEAVHLGLEKAAQLNWRTDNSARLVFLVGDAPPHRNQIETTFAAVDELRNLGVAIYPLAGSGTKDECEFIFRAMACLTRGQYLFLTDHSGVGHTHENPYTARFEVEPLNQLLIRVMAEEISGRSMLAQDVIAVVQNADGVPIAHVQPTPSYDESMHQHSHGHHTNHHVTYHHQPPREEVTILARLILGATLIALIFWIDRRLRLS